MPAYVTAVPSSRGTYAPPAIAHKVYAAARLFHKYIGEESACGISSEPGRLFVRLSRADSAMTHLKS